MTARISWGESTDYNTIEVRAVAESERLIGALPAKVVASPIVDLVNLAARGGLSGRQHPPENSTAHLVSFETQGRLLRWSLRVDQVAETILHNVRGALLYFDAEIARLEKITVVAPSRFLVGKERTLDDAAYDVLPFEVADERQEFRGLRIQINFERADRATMDRVEEDAFGAWVCAASAGCFCSEVMPPDQCRLYLGDRHHSPNALSLELEQLLLPEPAAMNSLINVLAWAHHHVSTIVSVEFYD